MKFHVNRDVFSEAVSFAVKLLPQRTTQPILSGVLIEAADGALVAVVIRLRGVVPDRDRGRGRRAGHDLVSGRLLANIASRLPNAPVQFSTDGGRSW